MSLLSFPGLSRQSAVSTYDKVFQARNQHPYIWDDNNYGIRERLKPFVVLRVASAKLCGGAQLISERRSFATLHQRENPPHTRGRSACYQHIFRHTAVFVSFHRSSKMVVATLQTTFATQVNVPMACVDTTRTI
jgi:hypothetical protein